MIQLRTIGILLVLLTSYLIVNADKRQVQQSNFNLICNGKYSKSYHKDYGSTSQYCSGLKACKADKLRLPHNEALAHRSDPCDFCYGQ
ncbi:MAG: hypothetical protein IPK88_12505 [Saprospiraceae bacterium]|nr:hypothetical protein [Candidatus Defluviibacterium haderslevense]